MKKSVINCRGFSLVQTMIGVGVVSIVATGMATAINGGFNFMSHSRSFNVAEDITLQVSGLMGDPNYCSKHFVGTNIPSTLPTGGAKIKQNIVLRDVRSNGTLGTEKILEKGKMYQNSVTVENLDLVVTNSVGANRYLGHIALAIKGRSGQSFHFNRQVAIHIATDSSRNIVSCSRLSEPTQGTQVGVYSQTCTDFAAKGWPTKEACLTDGRWHLIFRNSAGGAVLFGTKADLKAAVDAGATIRVNNANASQSETCQSVYQSELGSRPFYCLSPTRFAGELPPHLKPSSARFGTDGSLYCLSEFAPNSNGCSGTRSLNWFAKW